MRSDRSVRTQVISRFALNRVIELVGRGTPSGPVARHGVSETSSLTPLLHGRTEGNLVLVMDASATTKSFSLLLTDDHTMIGDALAHVLKTAGYAVERVSDGKAACARIESAGDQFDALIADHQVPRLSGVSLVESLRRVGFLGRILVYSAALSADDLKEYHALKAEPIVVGQSDSDRLLAIMKQLHGL